MPLSISIGNNIGSSINLDPPSDLLLGDSGFILQEDGYNVTYVYHFEDTTWHQINS